jgi:proline dehydrogenase
MQHFPTQKINSILNRMRTASKYRYTDTAPYVEEIKKAIEEENAVRNTRRALKFKKSDGNKN